MRINKIYLILVCISILFSSCMKKGKADFVRIQDDHFEIAQDTFFPLMLNYIVSVQSHGDQFIVAPSIYYDSCGYADAVGEHAVMKQLLGHFGLIKDLGFNSIRIWNLCT